MPLHYILDKFDVNFWESIQLHDKFSFVEQSIAIFYWDSREFYFRVTLVVKVQWSHCPIDEAIQDFESNLSSYYRQLFEYLVISLSFS